MISKYFMSEKTLKMWIEETGKDTYKDRQIEVDNSVPYGAVEHFTREEE